MNPDINSTAELGSYLLDVLPYLISSLAFLFVSGLLFMNYKLNALKKGKKGGS